MRIDIPALVDMLDERAARALSDTRPDDEWRVRSGSVGDHLPWGGDGSQLGPLPRDVVTIDGDMLRVCFGRLPRGQPERAYLAPEVEPIPIAAVVTAG